jgi:hypothetical protein
VKRSWGSASRILCRLVVAGLLSVAVKGAAQSVENSGHWEGTVFNFGLETVKQHSPSVLLFTARTEETYDSNLLSSQYAQLSTAYTLAEGKAQYSFEHPGNSVLLTYLGGGRFYSQYSNLNTSIQDGRLQWQARITKRLKFVASGRWADLPEGVVTEGNVNETLVLSNDFSALFLEQRAEVVEGKAGLEYHLAPHLVFDVGGDYDSTKNYGLRLINTRGEYAFGELSYGITAHQSLGLMYAHQWLYFTQGFASSQVDNLLLTYSNKLQRNLTFSVFGGPARTNLTPSTNTPTGTLRNPLQHLRQDGIVGGGELEAGFGHNKLRGGYTRVVSGGSGFLATELRQTIDFRISRSFSRKFEASFVGGYSSNRQIGGRADAAFSTYYIEPSIRYDITSRLRFSIRDSNGEVRGLRQFGSILRNQVSTQLEYRFAEIPFGR